MDIKQISDLILEVRKAEAEKREAENKVQEMEVRLVKALIKEGDPYLLKPQYGRLAWRIKEGK